MTGSRRMMHGRLFVAALSVAFVGVAFAGLAQGEPTADLRLRSAIEKLAAPSLATTRWHEARETPAICPALSVRATVPVDFCNYDGLLRPIRSQFTAKLRDYESGLNLDYFGARYYAGAMGRFTTPDWSETPQPVPYADFSDPQTLNLYAYARNGPLSLSDPDGHCGTLCTGAIGFVVGGLAGGAWEAGKQLYQEGEITDTTAIYASAAGGAVSGGLAGLTLGTSLGAQAGFVGTAAVSGGANVVGGGVNRAIKGEQVLDVQAAAVDFGAGAAGGVVGKAAANATVKSLVPNVSGRQAVNTTFNPSPYDIVLTTSGHVTVGSVQRVVQSSSNAAGNVVSNGVATIVVQNQSPPPPPPPPPRRDDEP